MTCRAALFFAAALVLSPLAWAQSQPATTYALTHAKIFTLAGSPIDDGTIVIRDGKIAAVGANVDIPPGAQVIDAKGLQVYPGLFDAVTQMGLREIGAVSSTVDSNETGNYNPDVVAATAVSPSSEHTPSRARQASRKYLQSPRAAAWTRLARAACSEGKRRRFTSLAGRSRKCS
jgi:imidazolonepropionase-like amidohydrolase